MHGCTTANIPWQTHRRTDLDKPCFQVLLGQGRKMFVNNFAAFKVLVVEMADYVFCFGDNLQELPFRDLCRQAMS